MRLTVAILLALLASCKSGNKEKQNSSTNSTNLETTPPVKDSIPVESVLAQEIKVKLTGNKWVLVDDKRANHSKDQFDYFIAPKRKDQPDYPYITQGDYDGDAQKDLAALVSDSAGKKISILVFTGSGKTISWDEDIMAEAALSTVPPGDVEGMDGENTKKVTLKWEAINVEYFETASFILYWDGKKFRRLQTGD